MEIKTMETGSGVVLKPDDGLDLLGYQELGAKLDLVLREGHKRVVLDLEDCSYANSSVARTLLAAGAKAKGAGGALALARVQGGARAMLEAAGVLAAVPTYDSVQDAMMALGMV